MPAVSPAFPTAAEVRRQTAPLVFSSFGESDAWALGRVLVTLAADLPVVINIRTPNRTLFHAALYGSSALNDNWARRKSNAALTFGVSSLEIGCKARETGSDFARHGLDSADFADAGGAVPIVVAGVGVVAAVTVSGLPQLEDHALVIAAMSQYLARVD